MMEPANLFTIKVEDSLKFVLELMDLLDLWQVVVQSWIKIVSLWTKTKKTKNSFMVKKVAN